MNKQKLFYRYAYGILNLHDVKYAYRTKNEDDNNCCITIVLEDTDLVKNDLTEEEADSFLDELLEQLETISTR